MDNKNKTFEDLVNKLVQKNNSLVEKIGLKNTFKRIVSLIVIFITLLAKNPIAYADTTEYLRQPTAIHTFYQTQDHASLDEVQQLILKAQPEEWTVGNKAVAIGEDFKIIDPNTGEIIYMKRTGGALHMDVETLTKMETQKMKNLWGGFSWERKPFLLVNNRGEVFMVSMHGMPHAGTDGYKGGQQVNFRSCNWGEGTNFDYVKGNDMDGHVCIHFRGSMTHCARKIDYRHQAEINELIKIKQKIMNELMKEM